MTNAPGSLVGRYGQEDLELLNTEERRRFIDDAPESLAWEILYRKEPELYERLIAGERIHPRVLDALPDARTVVEVAAGTGRLTCSLSTRYDRVVAVEPAASLRELLTRKRLSGVVIVGGYFDAIPVPDGAADLVVSCSAFTTVDGHGGAAGLAEMERATAPGGTIAFVWPAEVEWLTDRGFTYESFDGDMDVDFGTVDNAVELARIFYPAAADQIRARGNAHVPYDLLGMNPPRDWAHKRVL